MIEIVFNRSSTIYLNSFHKVSGLFNCLTRNRNASFITPKYAEKFTLKPRAMENKNNDQLSNEKYAVVTDRMVSLDHFVDADLIIDLQKKYQSNYQQLKKQEEIINITSHELKTPITTIKLFLNLLEELTQNEENHRVFDLVQKAEIQVNRLVKLVNNLQDISALQDGKIELNKENFDFSALLNSCTDTFRLQSPQHTLLLECNEGIHIFGDPSRIEQVLINFISNAIKYSPQGGRILIRAKKTADLLKVEVTDAGIGIPEAQVPYVFDCYYRAHPSDKRFKGSGLGLYICKEIITEHNGEIGTISEENKGSTFWFTLPLLYPK